MDHSSGVGEAGARAEVRMAPYDARELLADSFARLAVELHELPTTQQTAEAVVRFALHAVNCTHAGIALVETGGRIEIGTVTDPVVEAIYRLQIGAGAGPLVTAITEGRTVHVVAADLETRWPEWAAEVVAVGIGSVLYLPLVAGEKRTGVLSLYHTAPGAFADDDIAVAHVLARHASVAVATARQEEHLAQAADARKLVGQAMGILMERFDLDGDRAFEVLRRYSQDNNLKLRDVAQQLIDTRKLEGPVIRGPDVEQPAPGPSLVRGAPGTRLRGSRRGSAPRG